MNRAPIRVAAFAAACLGSFLAARAQITIDLPTLVGFKAPINEDNRMVAQVSGKEAKPSLTAGQVQITGFRLETYRYNPDQQTELVVESPLGVFGPSGASSDRSLTLRSADDRFAISGQGWSWDRITGLLTISNQVQTSLRRDPRATNQTPVQVQSRSFQYNLRTGDARFRDDCVATQPGRARIRAGELAARLTVRSERPDAIVATNGVTLELLRSGREGRASGTSALYTSGEDGEQITLAGPATWQFGPVEGTAAELVLEPAKDTYHARGQTHLRLATLPRGPRTNPPSSLPTATAAIPSSPTPPAGTNRPPLEIAAEAIDSTPGHLVFTGPVHATQSGRLELRAGRVVADLDTEGGPSRDALTRVVATESVEAMLRHGTNSMRLRGNEMNFTSGEHNVIEVVGNPSWQTAEYEGTADRFVIHPDVPTFQAVDHVSVRWRSDSRQNTNLPPIQLTADRLVADPAEARFTGSVRATQEQWQLTAAELDLRLATNGLLREIAARHDVVLDYQIPLPRRTPPPDSPSTTAAAKSATEARVDRGFAAAFRGADAAARRWRVQAADVTAVPTADGRDFDRLDASGGVRVDNPAAHAVGARLAYRAADGLVRLTEQAALQTVEGLNIVGEPGTSIGFHPATGRFVVEGPVKRMAVPALAFRSPTSTNTPAHR